MSLPTSGVPDARRGDAGLKVLMTADAVGNIWTYALELSAALARHDVSVVLATMGPRPDPFQREAAARIPNLQLVCGDFRLEWMPHAWGDLVRAGDWLLELAAEHDVDLVHLNGYVHAALGWSCPVLVVAHACVCSWWRAVHGADPPDRWDLYRLLVTRGIASADCVVAPTRAFLRDLHSCYGTARAGHIIRNGRSAEFASMRRPERREPLLLACGRVWDEGKNLAQLDAIASELAWPVYVAGSVAGPGGQPRWPRALRCLGALPAEELARWLARARILVHPAVYEPYGLDVLEAALSGCALALADLPSLRELWDGAAEFFDPRDPAELKRLLQGLISDPQRCRRLSAAARLRARAFRSEPMADSYARLYRALSPGAHPQRSAVA